MDPNKIIKNYQKSYKKIKTTYNVLKLCRNYPYYHC